MAEAAPALLYLPGLPGAGARVELAGPEAHYVARVCRARAGERLEATDGRGTRATLRLVEVRGVVAAEVESVQREPASRPCWVLCGAPEGERSDWLVEKLAELGVVRFQPVDTARASWRRAAGRRGRWERLAVAALRQSRRPFDLGRVQAIEYLDSALGADRRQLMKQYVENHDATGKLAERIWQAAYDLTQGFLHAYQTGLEEAVRQDGNSRWSAALPLLFARLLHYYGTDAKLRVFRFERWIPGKWMEVHRTYLRAAELGVDRAQAMLGSAGPNSTSWTPEQEYLNALLIHQLNTGNLSPSQLDWAGSQLRAWSRKLVLDAVPRSPEGFYVDLAGKAGLVRRTGTDAGSMLRYLDTTPLAESLERAVHALCSAEATDLGPAAPINQLRIAILDNFCWCSSDEPERLGQLKLAARGCYDVATAFGTPFISGKDSMYNDFSGFDAHDNPVKISVPPTLLISSIGVHDDVAKAVSMDAKIDGDLVYVIGGTSEELGGSDLDRVAGHHKQAHGRPSRHSLTYLART